MTTATISEIKKTLQDTHPAIILELCLKLAKYKKENKELLTYLLFEAGNEQLYIEGVKTEINLLFKAINKSNSYLAKKTIRKTLRITNKYIKYSGNKQTEVELLIFFCRKLKAAGLPIFKSLGIQNLYMRQIEKIKKAMLNLHEDIQFDFEEEIKAIL
jgi:hypothetical protein